MLVPATVNFLDGRWPVLQVAVDKDILPKNILNLEVQRLGLQFSTL